MKYFLIFLIAIAITATPCLFAQVQTTTSLSTMKTSETKSKPLDVPSIPNKISYQGVLTTSTGAPATDGIYDLKFELFDAASNGNSLWSETQTGVVVNKGTFSVLLGSVSPLPGIFYQPLWVEITAVAGPNISSPIVFSPRTELASVPYALGPLVKDGSSYYLPTGNLGISGAPFYYYGLDVLSPVHSVRTKMTEPAYSTGFWADKYDATANNYFVLQTGGMDRWSLGTIGNDDFSIYNWYPRGSYDLYITLSGLVGIGTSNPTKKLDVKGSVNAQDTVFAKAFIFNKPETSYVSGTAWASGRSLTIPDSFKYSTGLYNSKSSGSSHYEVDLHLPHGATLISVDVFGYDANASTQIYYNVGKRPNLSGSGNILASAGSGVAFAGGDIAVTAILTTPELIDNSQNSYLMELTMPATIQVKYYGYRATYITNAPGTMNVANSVNVPVIPENVIIDNPEQTGTTIHR